MNYNYVIFNYTDNEFAFNEEEDYYAICFRELKGRDDVILNHIPLQEQGKFVRGVYRFTKSRLFSNRYWRIPIQNVWFPLVFKNTFKDDKPICFVCLRYPPLKYLYYLKKRYPNSKFVKMSRDLIRTQLPYYNKYSKSSIFDLWLSYDEGDCSKYGFVHFDEFESMIDVSSAVGYPESDVFFAGRAKDRFTQILDIYDYLEHHNQKCLFYIVGVKDEEKVERPGIIYAENPMSYSDMLKYSIQAKCLLDINQKDAVGYTSRFIEAILLNKLLITNNMFVKNSKYYNPRFIQIINSSGDINPSLMAQKSVDYKYDGGFSPSKRLELIDSLL